MVAVNPRVPEVLPTRAARGRQQWLLVLLAIIVAGGEFRRSQPGQGHP
jgi:hypothetical protein